MDLSNGKHYVWTEEKIKRILLVDENNTDLSQLLTLILWEIVDDGFEVKSAGTQPGEELSDRVLAMGKERYGIDLKGLRKAQGWSGQDFIIMWFPWESGCRRILMNPWRKFWFIRNTKLQSVSPWMNCMKWQQRYAWRQDVTFKLMRNVKRK